jgi:ribosomal protein S18 acetylase RimI-like enzyme
LENTSIRELRDQERLPTELMLLADPDEHVINSYIGRSECFVMELNNEIIGVYLLLPTRPFTVELVNIAISDSCQGKGYGKQLVLHAINTARQEGYKTIEIGTGNSSIGQLALYQKCRLEIVGIDKGFFVRHYTEEIYENGIQCKDMIRLSLDL